jgi:tRNA (guanine-N7-)-methyltransferase
MRQKKVKYATPELLSAYGVNISPNLIELDPNRKTYLEIGSGKGQFIAAKALNHPEELWIAMEMNINVCYRILEKKNELKLDNLMIILGDAENLDLYFESSVLDGIYLNFSDPWPKKRHHKRRLTAPDFLSTYQHILKEGAFIQFRTDHADFFHDSIETMESAFDIMDCNLDLPESTYMTEYEVKKRQIGPIYQLTGKVRKHD